MRCLTPADLERFHADECPPARADEIARHLDACAACAALDADVVARHEGLITRIRSVGPPPAKRPARARPSPVTLPGYEMREELQRGGQGIVYRAWQQSTRREVAVKLLRDGHDAGPVARRRFEREIEVVAGLRHPGVVQVFDSGTTDDGRRYIVMDCVDGLRLDRYVAARNCDLPTRLRLFAAICDAVHHAHQRGVIHRDLKPSNILVRGDGRPCVLDFGLARQLDEGEDRGRTLSGHVAGTLAYLSPEQARGLPDAIDVRSDVYTLGVLLYELLCGSSPYDAGGDTVSMLQAIATSDPPGPLRFADETGLPGGRLPGDLETIVRTALAKDRARRYQTADALAGDVRSFLDGEPIAARRDSGLYLVRMLLRRYRAIVGLAAALLVVSVGSAVALGWLYAEQSAQRTRAEQARREAEAAREVADDRFKRLRELANAFTFDLDPKLEQLPGSAAARGFIAETITTYLDALRDEAGADVTLSFELGRAYLRMGEVLGDLSASSAEDLPSALHQYEEARAIAERLLADGGESLGALYLLHRTQLRIGDAYGQLGRVEESRATQRAALAVAERIAAAAPDAIDTLNTLAGAHERVGNAEMLAGDLEAATVAYEKSMDYGRRYAAHRPDDLWALRGVGVSHTKLAQIATGRGDPEAALEHYRSFLRISEQVFTAHPNNRAARHDLAVANEWHCILLTQLDRSDEALPFCERSVAVQQELVEVEGDSDRLRRGLASKLTKLIETQVALARYEAAAAACHRLIAVTEDLVDDSADPAAALRLLGVAHYKRYELHKQRADEDRRNAADRADDRAAAERALRACLDVFLDARESGLLRPADAGVPETLEQELANLAGAADAD